MGKQENTRSLELNLWQKNINVFINLLLKIVEYNVLVFVFFT